VLYFELILVGSKLTVSGWGYINTYILPKHLQQVTLPVIKRPACARAWRSNTPTLTIKIQHICAGTNAKGFCQVTIIYILSYIAFITLCVSFIIYLYYLV
jgi:hypothetical protein